MSGIKDVTSPGTEWQTAEQSGLMGACSLSLSAVTGLKDVLNQKPLLTLWQFLYYAAFFSFTSVMPKAKTDKMWYFKRQGSLNQLSFHEM